LKFLRKSDERKNAVVDNNMDALAWLRKQLDGDETIWFGRWCASSPSG
jgi:hypothetical protein